MDNRATSVRVNTGTVDRMRRLATAVAAIHDVAYTSDDERLNALMDVVAQHYRLRNRQSAQAEPQPELAIQ